MSFVCTTIFEIPAITTAEYNLTMKTVAIEHIELRPARDGSDRAFVAGTRVGVHDIYVLVEDHGKSADEVVAAYPHLTLGQVHAALAYGYDHRTEIVEQLRAARQFAQEMESRTGPGPLAAKLKATGHDGDPLPSG
jgi:uncharacterized protein (DUF433 family)